MIGDRAGADDSAVTTASGVEGELRCAVVDQVASSILLVGFGRGRAGCADEAVRVWADYVAIGTAVECQCGAIAGGVVAEDLVGATTSAAGSADEPIQIVVTELPIEIGRCECTGTDAGMGHYRNECGSRHHKLACAACRC